MLRSNMLKWSQHDLNMVSRWSQHDLKIIKCIFSTGYAKGSGAQSELTVSLVRKLLHRVQLMHDKELGLCKILQVVFFYQAICWRWTAGLLQCHIRVIRVTRIATVEFKEDYGTEPSRYCLQQVPYAWGLIMSVKLQSKDAAKISWTLGAWSHDCANLLQLLAQA